MSREICEHTDLKKTSLDQVGIDALVYRLKNIALMTQKNKRVAQELHLIYEGKIKNRDFSDLILDVVLASGTTFRMLLLEIEECSLVFSRGLSHVRLVPFEKIKYISEVKDA